jgi:hypothetical protein
LLCWLDHFPGVRELSVVLFHLGPKLQAALRLDLLVV